MTCPICHGDFQVTGEHEVYRICPCGETVKDHTGNWFRIAHIHQNYIGGAEGAAVEFAKTCGDGTFIDVGANRGQWSLLFRDQFKQIISFEPEPVNFLTLQAVTKPYSWITPFNLAVSDKREQKTLYLFHDSTQLHNLLDGTNGRVEVQCVPLYDYLTGPVDLVKVDAEGYEGQVISGCRDRIRQVKHWILEKHLNQNHEPLLTSLGYDVSPNSNGWFATLKE